MILPIYVYGQPVLRKKASTIEPAQAGVEKLIADMWETLPVSDGVGLAAPQVGHALRLFIVDASGFAEDYPEVDGFKKTFINAEIIDRTGNDIRFNEGCLSLPNIREDVIRKDTIRIKYVDENFTAFDEEYSGIIARIIQHEYDHIEGKLLIDHLSPIKRRLLKPKLEAISLGKVDVPYKMKLPK